MGCPLRVPTMVSALMSTVVSMTARRVVVSYTQNPDHTWSASFPDGIGSRAMAHGSKSQIEAEVKLAFPDEELEIEFEPLLPPSDQPRLTT